MKAFSVVVVLVMCLASCGRTSDPDQALDVLPSCKPPPESCRQLLRETFGEPSPGLVPPSVGQLRLSSGERSGKVFLWAYNGSFGGEERAVIAGVKKRTTGGYEPPDDAAVFTLTPAGRSVVMRPGPDSTVAGVDFWTDSYHYAVSLQGTFDAGDPVVAATLALVDALPESE